MSPEQALAERVVAGMLARDAFTRWLGAEVVETAPRRSVVRMAVGWWAKSSYTVISPPARGTRPRRALNRPAAPARAPGSGGNVRPRAARTTRW